MLISVPRHVDPERRRADLAHAVWRVVITSGLAKASVRSVAREAGLSVGSVRHYFPDQKALQGYAFDLITERVDLRLSRIDATLPLRERIEAVMWAMLPMTPGQVEEEQVRLAYLIEARTDPGLSAAIQSEREESMGLTRQAVTALRDAGLAPADLDVEATTIELLALLDGLSQAAALYPGTVPPDLIASSIRRWLDSLLQAGPKSSP